MWNGLLSQHAQPRRDSGGAGGAHRFHRTAPRSGAAPAYIGFGNTHDITNTITIWQRLVGVTATVYAGLAVVAFAGYARRARWLGAVLWIWGALVVFTSFMASLVYGTRGGANVLVLLATAVLPALTIWASRGRARGSGLRPDTE